MTLFTAIDSPQYGSVYRSDTHEIVHSVGGFGIAVARVYLRGKSEMLKEFSGPLALQRAMSWCQQIPVDNTSRLPDDASTPDGLAKGG